MCGILGIISKSISAPLEGGACRRALAKLAWRGPDLSTSNIIMNGRVFLGQTVLSLTGDISQSQGEHLVSDSGRFSILFNGEIYNYRELNRRFLGSRKPTTITDSEVLVNLNEKIPLKQVPRELDGMYAYLLFDRTENKIYLGRDPQGEKSLYIYEDDSLIIIASEIRAITGYKKDIPLDREVFRDYFYTRHFMQIERTSRRGIRQLKPGHLECLDLASHRWSVVDRLSMAEWIDPQRLEVNGSKHVDALTDELDALLSHCAREMIPVDRRYAAVVSGGVDSSLLAKYVVQHGSPDVLVAVNHVGKDEISHDLTGFEAALDHKIDILNVDVTRYAAEVVSCQRVLGSPLLAHSFVGQSVQSAHVRSAGCKAFFGGDGADELFGGYSCYLDQARREKPGLDQSYAFSPSDYAGFFSPKSNYFEFKDHDESKMAKELSAIWRESVDAYQAVTRSPGELGAQAMMYCDLAHQLASVGMRGTDLMSMMWSVETRSIFLRRPIIQFGLNLPVRYKSDIDAQVEPLMRAKPLLKRLFLRYFPAKLLVKKQGFAGFPNESAVYLGRVEDFLAIDFLGLRRETFDPARMSRAMAWKLINVEHFLREQ